MMSNKIGKTKLLMNLGLMAVMTGATVYAAYRVSEGPLGLGSKATNNSAILSANTMNEEVMVNELFEVQIYMLPEGNQVGGVDAVLTYEPTFIEPVTVVKDIASPFAGFVANIDAQRGRIEMNSVVYQNGQMGGWVTEPAAIAKVTFKARVMTNPTTLIGFDYEQGRTTDSNVAVVFEGEVVDALLDQPKELQIAIVSRPEPTIAPTATPTPTVKLVPTSTPRVVPTLAPTPTLRLTPTVQPTPTLVPEEIVVHRAQMEGKLLWRRLVVVATDSLAPEAFLTVYDHSNSTEIGVLRYNKYNNSYGGEFSVKTRIRKIRVESHYGNSVVAEVQK